MKIELPSGDDFKKAFEEANKRALNRTRTGENDEEYASAINEALDRQHENKLLLDTFVFLATGNKASKKEETALKNSIKGYLRKSPGNLSMVRGKKDDPFTEGRYLWIIREEE